MQYNIESYIAEKEARERRVLVYTEKIPVSYTHLDVYKRQEYGRG